MTYAKGTDVPVRKSRQDIEDMLEKHRASRMFIAMESGSALVGFTVDDRTIQFELSLPKLEDFATFRDRFGYVRTRPNALQFDTWEQACREKWRALVLALKSKFVSIETGIETTEQAFFAHLVVRGSNGERITAHRWLKAQIGEENFKALPPGEAR